MNIINKWLNGIGWFFILFMPFFFLIVMPISVIHDYLDPWQEELEDLEKKKPNSVRLLVGSTGYSAIYYGDGGYESHKRREWVVFPSVFTEPHTYAYYRYEIKKPGFETEFSKSNQTNEKAALGYLFLNVAAYCFCWFVSKPRITKWYEQRTA